MFGFSVLFGPQARETQSSCNFSTGLASAQLGGGLLLGASACQSSAAMLRGRFRCLIPRPTKRQKGKRL